MSWFTHADSFSSATNCNDILARCVKPELPLQSFPPSTSPQYSSPSSTLAIVNRHKPVGQELCIESKEKEEEEEEEEEWLW